MNLLERIEDWAYHGITTDITTMILRSEGYADEEIRAAYDEVLANPDYGIIVERGIARIVKEV
jgi:hypothetical protein